ncbi:MAG: hypothetical protein DMG79_16400 [Acidobacteria bacterium]|nr:MAG: hypothetical protein DMG79_16400 [Acidobacteriota bacterium]
MSALSTPKKLGLGLDYTETLGVRHDRTNGVRSRHFIPDLGLNYHFRKKLFKGENNSEFHGNLYGEQKSGTVDRAQVRDLPFSIEYRDGTPSGQQDWDVS